MNKLQKMQNALRDQLMLINITLPDDELTALASKALTTANADHSMSPLPWCTAPEAFDGSVDIITDADYQVCVATVHGGLRDAVPIIKAVTYHEPLVEALSQLLDIHTSMAHASPTTLNQCSAAFELLQRIKETNE